MNGDYLIANWRYFLAFDRKWKEQEIKTGDFDADGNVAYDKVLPDITFKQFPCGTQFVFSSQSSRPQKEIFLNLLSWLRQRNIEPIFLLTPVHQSILDCEGTKIALSSMNMSTKLAPSSAYPLSAATIP